MKMLLTHPIKLLLLLLKTIPRLVHFSSQGQVTISQSKCGLFTPLGKPTFKASLDLVEKEGKVQRLHW